MEQTPQGEAGAMAHPTDQVVETGLDGLVQPAKRLVLLTSRRVDARRVERHAPVLVALVADLRGVSAARLAAQTILVKPKA